MDINTEEIKKKLLEKTESVKKTVEEKAGRTLPWTKIAAALVGVVLVVGVAAGVGGKKESSKSEDSSKSETAKVKTLSPKKVPEYLTVKDKEDGTWIIGYNASIIPENLVIPDGIVGIATSGLGVFRGCELLESVKIPGSVKTIGQSAFSRCTALASVTLAKGVKKILWDAFYGCTSLKSITIPEGGVEIYEGAFKDCTALESVTIAKDVATIGGGTFKGCTSLKEVRYKNTVKRFKLIAANTAFEEGVVIHCTDGDYVFGSDAE